MKKLKFLSVLFCCLAAMSFTSCDNGNDDVQPLTKEQIAQCFTAVKGTYTGKVIYSSINPNNPNDVTDTLNIQWAVNTDSTLVISKLPAKILAQNINNTDLKTALSAAADQDFTCYTGFTKTSPVTFLLNPVTASYSLTYGGATHKVQVAFYINSYYSYGVYGSTVNSQNMMQMQIMEGAIYVDGTQTSYLTGAVPFLFSGTKN